MHINNIKSFFVVAIVASAALVQAQDTLSKQTINITSTYKPSLMDAAKINFVAAPPVPDSSRPILQYQIPVQSLSRQYQPLNISPLALNVDSLNALKWQPTNFIKLGYGNLNTPYARAGISFSDGANANGNVLAHFTSSKSKEIRHQQFMDGGVEAYGSYTTDDRHEAYAKANFNVKQYHLYGYDQNRFDLSKTDVSQRFLTFGANVGFRNTEDTEFGLRYKPEIGFSTFGDNHSGKELSLKAGIPVQKSLSDALSLKLGVSVDYTRYTNPNISDINNTIVLVPFSVDYKSDFLSLHAGAIPSWDRSQFRLLPDITADFLLGGNEFIFQAGWVQHYEKGTYQRWAGLNPYLAQPSSLFNTRISEIYGGIKGTLIDKFFYNAKAGVVNLHNMPLFANRYVNNAPGNHFDVVYEERLTGLHMHGEIGAVQAEDFSVSAKFDWYIFNKQKTGEETWGFIPRELTTSLKWRVISDLWFTSDLYFFEGAKYRNPDLTAGTGRHPVDLSAGLEFKITPKFDLWVQANNVFNNRYQRWHQYNVFGFNMLGGIRYNF